MRKIASHTLTKKDLFHTMYDREFHDFLRLMERDGLYRPSCGKKEGYEKKEASAEPVGDAKTSGGNKERHLEKRDSARTIARSGRMTTRQ